MNLLAATPSTEFSPGRRCFTASEFERMIQSGVLGSEERLELLEGDIVQTTPVGAAHVRVLAILQHLLAPLAAQNLAIIYVQSPLFAGADSAPQPDLVVTTYHEAFHPGYPTPEMTRLVVEVADTSLRHDRAVKGPIYAKTGIPEFWIIDIGNRRVERFRDPIAGEARYGTSDLLAEGAVLCPASFPDFKFPVSRLFAFSTAP